LRIKPASIRVIPYPALYAGQPMPNQGEHYARSIVVFFSAGTDSGELIL
jgi:hypothetical protein